MVTTLHIFIITTIKLPVKIREINQPLDEFEDAAVSFLDMHQTCLFATTELLLQMQPVEIIQPHQHLPWSWKLFTTIALLYPDFGELGFLFGEEGSGFDGLEGS